MNRNWPYRYCTWLYRYADYSMRFTLNQSLSESMQVPTHIAWSSVFPSQETGTDTCSSSHAKFQQVFPLSISLARVAFSLVNLQNIFPLIASGVNTDARCEHRRFYMATSMRLVSYILTEIGPCGELLSKQTNFLVQPYALLARIMLQNFASLFSPATILLASLHKTHIYARL